MAVCSATKEPSGSPINVGLAEFQRTKSERQSRRHSFHAQCLWVSGVRPMRLKMDGDHLPDLGTVRPDGSEAVWVDMPREEE